MPQTRPSQTQLIVAGMTCANCARKVSMALQSVPGVRSVTVEIEHKSALVSWKEGASEDASALLAAIQAAGYDARSTSKDTCSGNSKHEGWHINLWLALAVAGFLSLGEWVFGLGVVTWYRWVSFGLAVLVQVYCGAQFYSGAWRQLKIGAANMDTLVALGSTAAFGYSTWVLLNEAFGVVSSAGGAHVGHTYFMEGVAIIAFISGGHWLERRVCKNASKELRSLLNLVPESATRLRVPLTNAPGLSGHHILKFQPAPKNLGTEEKVAVSELLVGDLVVLRPGERVPVDGSVTEGVSAVDEAMLTGESAAVEKQVGSSLLAGTFNLSGRLVIRVTATGEATALANIITTVRRAQDSRADIQRIGDRISAVFVPAVLIIAIVAGLLWGFLAGAERAFITAAAVLIVACPCAMGLATPVAIMASANAAAKRGILIRDGVALEKAGRITAVIFDKTGTLTAGKPELMAVGLPASGQRHFISNADRHSWCELDSVRIATALARNSTHPISRALTRVPVGDAELEGWHEVPGSGMEARFRLGAEDWRCARLGAVKWLRESRVDLAFGEQLITEWSESGATVVGLSVGNNLSALFAVKDALKADAATVVSDFQQQRLKTYLITGDNEATAVRVAALVGIAKENVYAGVRPEQKAEFVRRLQGEGERVAFVGDGINDAPAILQADLGIAVSQASDIAREAADLILLKSEIAAVPEALELARSTLRIIKQNLFWAFFYNAAAVPLAAAGLMSPILCALAMGASDLIVIGNALRLLRRENRTG